MKTGVARRKRHAASHDGFYFVLGRDLISSADTIQYISQQCRELHQKLEQLQEQVTASSNLSEKTTVEGEENTERALNERFEVANAVKYVIDSQESIYGYTDRHEYFMAVIRYLRALEIYKWLTSNEMKSVNEKMFPFLEHQWPQVRNLETEIWSKAQTWLGESRVGATSTPHASISSNLLSLATLRPIDGIELLRYFLNGREAYLLSIVSNVQNLSPGAHDANMSLARVFLQLTQGICESLGQVVDIFRTGAPFEIPQNVLRSLDDVSVPHGGTKSSFLEKRLQEVKVRLADISSASIQLECHDWITKLSAKLSKTLQNLLEHITTCDDLEIIENKVANFLHNWSHQFDVGEEDESLQADKQMVIMWPDICQTAIGQVINLWDLLYEKPLIERAKNVMKDYFATMLEETATITSRLLQVEGRPITHELKGIDDFHIESTSEYALPANNGLDFLWMDVSKEVLAVIDKCLQGVVLASICVTRDVENAEKLRSIRSRTIEDFVLENFQSTMKAMAEHLNNLLLKSRQSEAVAAPAILFVTDLIRNITTDCAGFLSIMRGSIDSWSKAMGGQQLGEAVQLPWARATLADLQQVSEKAEAMWASLCGEALREQLKPLVSLIPSSMSMDRYAYSVGMTSEEGEQTMHLPIMPSPEVMTGMLSFSGVLESHGGSKIGEEMLKIAYASFRNEITALLGHRLEDFKKMKGSNAGKAPALLQLAYDLMFLDELFRSKLDPVASSVLISVSQEIDPIDWASYEPVLQQNAKKFCHNSSLLLHGTLHHEKNSIGNSLKSEKANESLALAPCPSRYVYLPAKLPSKVEGNRLEPKEPVSREMETSRGRQSIRSNLGGISFGKTSSLASLIGSKAAEVSAKIEGYSASDIFGSLQLPFQSS